MTGAIPRRAAGRLRDQHDWHLRNARRFLVRYVLFQVAVLLCSVVSLVYAYQVGRRFDVIAGTMALSLMLMGLRDFLGYGPQCLRYVKVAGNLTEIEVAYLTVTAPLDQPDPTTRCRRLAEEVEDVLAQEFQYWYGSRQA